MRDMAMFENSSNKTVRKIEVVSTNNMSARFNIGEYTVTYSNISSSIDSNDYTKALIAYNYYRALVDTMAHKGTVERALITRLALLLQPLSILKDAGKKISLIYDFTDEECTDFITSIDVAIMGARPYALRNVNAESSRNIMDRLSEIYSVDEDTMVWEETYTDNFIKSAISKTYNNIYIRIKNRVFKYTTVNEFEISEVIHNALAILAYYKFFTLN